MKYCKARLEEIWHRIIRNLNKAVDEPRPAKKAQTGLPREICERYLTMTGRNGKPVMEEI